MSNIRSLDPKAIPVAELQSWLQHGIAPRPICFASTVSKDGVVNLSPFSFFNLFSTMPPVCIFSPSRRVRDCTIKHTLENVLEVPEVVINIVNYSMVQQMSLSSTEYPKGINEFEKSGLTMLPSDLIRPPRVAESPMQLECKVTEIKPLGTGPGAGNLVLAEVLRLHIKESVIHASGSIDQGKMDLVARLGANWYCRVGKENLFEVAKPLKSLGIGVDALPSHVFHSEVLSGNDLGRLGNLEALPTDPQLSAVHLMPEVRDISNQALTKVELTIAFHRLAKQYIRENNLETALAILCSCPIT